MKLDLRKYVYSESQQTSMVTFLSVFSLQSDKLLTCHNLKNMWQHWSKLKHVLYNQALEFYFIHSFRNSQYSRLAMLANVHRNG